MPEKMNHVIGGDARWWQAVLYAALAGGMAWGIRGQYGHETGAMIAGLPSVGINVLDVKAVPLPVARYFTGASEAATLMSSSGERVKLEIEMRVPSLSTMAAESPPVPSTSRKPRRSQPCAPPMVALSARSVQRLTRS